MTSELPIEGLAVGHYSDSEGVTGCTVVLAPQGFTASVDIRGGAPGSLETALLSPFCAVGEVHGILLTGGSAPGLGAAAGVSTFLRERGCGYATQCARIPLVTGAVIYDLGIGRVDACPSPENAYEACQRASSQVEEGSVGAGTGATVGKILGPECMMKGGVGLSTLSVGDGVTVSALSVVNALGDVLDEQAVVLAGARREGSFLRSGEVLRNMSGPPRLTPLNDTTLSVVMTDGRLDKLQCAMVARMAHDGLSRAIDPVHTPVDGDTVFVVATGKKPANVFQSGAAAAEVVAASIRRAVRVCDGLDGVVAVSETQ